MLHWRNTRFSSILWGVCSWRWLRTVATIFAPKTWPRETWKCPPTNHATVLQQYVGIYAKMLKKCCNPMNHAMASSTLLLIGPLPFWGHIKSNSKSFVWLKRECASRRVTIHIRYFSKTSEKHYTVTNWSNCHEIHRLVLGSSSAAIVEEIPASQRHNGCPNPATLFSHSTPVFRRGTQAGRQLLAVLKAPALTRYWRICAVLPGTM